MLSGVRHHILSYAAAFWELQPSGAQHCEVGKSFCQAFLSFLAISDGEHMSSVLNAIVNVFHWLFYLLSMDLDQIFLRTDLINLLLNTFRQL